MVVWSNPVGVSVEKRGEKPSERRFPWNLVVGAVVGFVMAFLFSR